MKSTISVNHSGNERQCHVRTVEGQCVLKECRKIMQSISAKVEQLDNLYNVSCDLKAHNFNSANAISSIASQPSVKKD